MLVSILQVGLESFYTFENKHKLDLLYFKPMAVGFSSCFYVSNDTVKVCNNTLNFGNQCIVLLCIETKQFFLHFTGSCLSSCFASGYAIIWNGIFPYSAKSSIPYFKHFDPYKIIPYLFHTL